MSKLVVYSWKVKQPNNGTVVKVDSDLATEFRL
jgi:hypothetical protein